MAEIAPWDEAKQAQTPASADRAPWEEANQGAPSPETTAGGLAASAARGLGPIAMGAAAGAAIGAPIGGVGAIPGAAIGAGATTATEFVTNAYNRFAKQFGWPETATPQEMSDRIMDTLGVRRPGTGAERMVEAMAGGAASALAPARAAEELASHAGGLIGSVTARLAERPGLQAASGAAGGASGQLAAEAGAGPTGQAAASWLGGSTVYWPRGVAASVATDPRQAAMAARHVGYVLPPAAISERPGIISNVLAGWGGKIKTAQAASTANQHVTNQLAAQALGLPPDTVLTDQVFHGVRQQAGDAYRAVANSVPVIHADPHYMHAIPGLGGRNSQAAQLFPRITRNPGIDELIDELQNVQVIPTGVGLEIVKELRFNGNNNLRAMGDPSRHALGLAQRSAADLIDELMDRNISAAGQPGLIDAYRQARVQIARSYDIEGATNIATGDVSAPGLARLAARGRPLTGELDTIAHATAAFPTAMRTPAGFGYDEQMSGLDFFGAMLSLAHGHPEVAGTIVGRPVARATILSQPYQRAMTNAQPAGVPLPLITNPGMESTVDPASGAMGLR